MTTWTRTEWRIGYPDRDAWEDGFDSQEEARQWGEEVGMVGAIVQSREVTTTRSPWAAS